MNRHDWQQVYGNAPDSFRFDLIESLNSLEEEQSMKKRYKISTILLAAAIAVMILSGAAFAATQIRSFDFLQITPLEGGEALVSTNIATVGDEYIRLDVEEAIFDGEGLIVQFRITPQQPDRYNLSGDHANSTITIDPENPFIFHHLTTSFDNSILGEDGLDSWVYETTGDSLIAYGVHFSKPLDSTINMTARLQYETLDQTGISGSLDVSFALNAAESNSAAYALTPVVDEFLGNTCNGIELISGAITLSEAFGHYELRFGSEIDPSTFLSGNDRYAFYLMDHSNTEYPLRSYGDGWHYDETAGTWQFERLGIMQPIVSVSESMMIIVRVAETGEYVGALEVTTSPTE